MSRISTRGPSSGGGGGGGTANTAGATPNLYGLKGWTFDPLLGTSTQVLTSGTLYASVCAVRPGETEITEAKVYVHAAGSGLTYARQALYALDGTLLGSTGDIASSLQGTGLKAHALPSPAQLPPGTEFIYAAILAVGTTGPTLPRTPSPANAAILQFGQSQLRSGTIAGLSVLPANLNALNTSNLTLLQAIA